MTQVTICILYNDFSRYRHSYSTGNIIFKDIRKKKLLFPLEWKVHFIASVITEPIITVTMAILLTQT